jgi:hypothetical protein
MDLLSALQKIKLDKNANPMKILSDTSAVEVRSKKPILDGRKIEVVQGCAEEDYALVIVVADGMAQIQSSGTRDATALDPCKAMKKVQQLAGHSDNNDKDDDNNNDSVGLETSLGAVKHKQSSIHKKKCFHCSKKGHRLSLCTDKKKKGRSEKAGTATDASTKKTRPKCSHCSHPGHTENDCWKKHLHKAPSKSSWEASGAFLDKVLLVCNIAVDDATYITQDIETVYYCIPITEDRQWDDPNRQMGLIKSLPNQVLST